MNEDTIAVQFGKYYLRSVATGEIVEREYRVAMPNDNSANAAEFALEILCRDIDERLYTIHSVEFAHRIATVNIAPMNWQSTTIGR